jgi:hypothetical protein
MASLLDIEDTLSDETTIDIVCKQWYWNEFLPKLDEDNIRNDYRLVYQDFSEHEWKSFPYNYPEHAWEWLLENKIMVLSRYDDSDLYGWYYKHEDQPTVYINVNDCYKYRLTDKFFEDYQKNVISRRSAEETKSFEEWLYYLDVMQKYGYDSSYYHSNMKKHAWPRSYEPII